LKHLPKKQTWPRGAIFTVGHSTSIDRFITLIDSYGIERLADVRHVPRSPSVASEIRESVDAEPAIFTTSFLTWT